jgi:hypothetical protein
MAKKNRESFFRFRIFSTQEKLCLTQGFEGEMPQRKKNLRPESMP